MADRVVPVAQAFARKSATELESRSKREETMRNVRWAAELSVGAAERAADLGVAELVALVNSDLLEEPQKIFVEAALSTVYEDPQQRLDRLGGTAEVVEYSSGQAGSGRDTTRLSSESDADDGGMTDA